MPLRFHKGEAMIKNPRASLPSDRATCTLPVLSPEPRRTANVPARIFFFQLKVTESQINLNKKEVVS